MHDFEATIYLQGVIGDFNVVVKARDSWQAQQLIIQMYAHGDSSKISFIRYPTEKR